VLAGKGVTAWQRTLASLVPAARAAPGVLAAVALAGTSPGPAP
jgi:hypothetical protein